MPTPDLTEKKLSFPALIRERGNYSVRIAETPEEIRRALDLRTRVFFGGKNKADSDSFDEKALHLLILRKNDDSVIGTCRLITGPEFYSETEFSFLHFDRISSDTLEVGRTCIAPEERRGSAAGLLLFGIAQVLSRLNRRYLAGCASLGKNDRALARILCGRPELFSSSLRAIPRPEYAMELEPCDGSLNGLPPLFKEYLRMGAKLCGKPAFDADFGSIDFFILLDASDLPRRCRKHFKLNKGF